MCVLGYPMVFAGRTPSRSGWDIRWANPSPQEEYSEKKKKRRDWKEPSIRIASPPFVGKWPNLTSRAHDFTPLIRILGPAVATSTPIMFDVLFFLWCPNAKCSGVSGIWLTTNHLARFHTKSSPTPTFGVWAQPGPQRLVENVLCFLSKKQSWKEKRWGKKTGGLLVKNENRIKNRAPSGGATWYISSTW